jgi:hypothetical protein
MLSGSNKSGRGRWHDSSVARKVGFGLRHEYRRLRNAAAPLLGAFTIVGIIQLASSLRLGREDWAWILIAGLVYLVVATGIQERRALAAKDEEIAAKEAQLAERTRKAAHAPLLAMTDVKQWLADSARDSMGRARERDAERRTERKEALTALHQEYLLSGDGISAALLAGTERPPEDWMRRRVCELGWERLLPEYAEPKEKEQTS